MDSLLLIHRQWNVSTGELRKTQRSNEPDERGVSCLDCETRLDGQEDTSAGKLHGCSEVVLHAPQEIGTEEDGLENTGKNRPPLLVTVCLCHSLQEAGRKKTSFIGVQSGSLAPQLFNCLTIVQYAIESCGGVWEHWATYTSDFSYSFTW